MESAGATEGAPASGTAEIIVDITTTGATLAANALKTLDDGTILKSEAQLVASLTASWEASHRETARSLLQRITVEETARFMREIKVDAPTGASAVLARPPAKFGAKRAEFGNGSLSRFFVRREDTHGFLAIGSSRKGQRLSPSRSSTSSTPRRMCCGKSSKHVDEAEKASTSRAPSAANTITG